MSDKVTIREIISSDTKVSSMRWAFVQMVKLTIALVVLTVLAAIIDPFMPEGKHIDLASLITLNGVVMGITFAGKAVQSFSKNDGTTMTSEITTSKEESH